MKLPLRHPSHRARRVAVHALAIVLGGCFGGPLVPSRATPLEAPTENGPDEHLLLFPTGDARALLGCSVVSGDKGSWIVADERAPGCHVSVRERESAWTREYHADLSELALARASFGTIVDLRARYGSQIRVAAEVQNSKELVADLDGPCGDLVIKAVKVGTGTRDVQYRKEGELSANAGVSELGAAAGAGHWESSGQRITWEREQAWAFTVGRMEAAEELALSVKMPTELTDGDEYTIHVSAAQRVWLVVLYVESEGRAGVLFPHPDHPDLELAPLEPTTLPTARVRLRNPGEDAREKVVVYAFRAHQDYEDFKPPLGAVSEAELAAYYRELPQRLSEIPRRRWDVAEINYLIHARAAGSSSSGSQGSHD